MLLSRRTNRWAVRSGGRRRFAFRRIILRPLPQMNLSLGQILTCGRTPGGRRRILKVRVAVPRRSFIIRTKFSGRVTVRRRRNRGRLLMKVFLLILPFVLLAVRRSRQKVQLENVLKIRLTVSGRGLVFLVVVTQLFHLTLILKFRGVRLKFITFNVRRVDRSIQKTLPHVLLGVRRNENRCYFPGGAPCPAVIPLGAL